MNFVIVNDVSQILGLVKHHVAELITAWEVIHPLSEIIYTPVQCDWGDLLSVVAPIGASPARPRRGVQQLFKVQC